MVTAKKRFAIGLSFPGQHRRFVKNVADQLAIRLGKDRIFYDRWYESELHGSDADSEFRRVYGEQCELLVPFFSEHYKTNWCRLEWSAIRGILLTRRRERSVVPVRLDGTVVEGWEPTDLAIRKKRLTGRQVAEKILEVYQKRFGQEDAGVQSTTPQNMEPPSAARNGREPAARDPDIGATSAKLEISADGEQDPAPGHGFIIVADISDSSSLPGRELRRVIKELWKFPEALSLQRTGNTASGILDGLLLVVRDATYETIVAACQEWIERMQQNASVALRLAVHRGDYHHVNEGSPVIVGPAPNECSRMVRIAGPGQIIVSEEFVNSWRRECGDNAVQDIFPGLQEPAWQIQQKPGSVSSVRLLNGRTQQVRPPSPLQQIHQAEQALRELLEEIESDFSDEISEIDSTLTSRRLGARISIFVTNQADDRLVATDFRFLRHRDAKDLGSTMAGSTEYGIHRDNRGGGTVGRAYLTRGSQAVKDLPPYRQNAKKYAQVLSAKPWFLAESVVAQMGRKARAYLAVPFALTAKPAPPDGVICIDTKNPLTNVPLDELILIGELIGLQYGILLAALWRLRV